MDDVTRETQPDDSTRRQQDAPPAWHSASGSDFTQVVQRTPRPAESYLLHNKKTVAQKMPRRPASNGHGTGAQISNWPLLALVMAVFAGTLLTSLAAFVVLRFTSAARNGSVNVLQRRRRRRPLSWPRP
jgi:hypothetical protein